MLRRTGDLTTGSTTGQIRKNLTRLLRVVDSIPLYPKKERIALAAGVGGELKSLQAFATFDLAARVGNGVSVSRKTRRQSSFGRISRLLFTTLSFHGDGLASCRKTSSAVKEKNQFAV